MTDDRLRKSRDQERKLAKRTNGRVQPRSGAGPWRKGDVRFDDYLVEAKRTDAGSWSFKAEAWEIIRRHALMEGRLPMIHLEMGGRSFLIVEEGDLPRTRKGGGAHP